MSNPAGSSAELPVIFCLHYLGGSANEWAPVTKLLHGDVRLVAIDLPGFGSAAQTQGYSVSEMADTIAGTISSASPERWLLAGHSMGAKVAAVLARRAENGDERLAGLAGLVLLAGSPPSPEPMEESDRETMLGWFANGPESSRAEAEQYVAKNSGPGLDRALATGAVEDVLHANRAAWVAWLESGSREDWSKRVGVLQTPALIIAGADDQNLGPDAQQRFMAPHFANVRIAALANTKHLLPLERPNEVARLIVEHVRAIEYRALIASTRVSTGTRQALSDRGAQDDSGYEAVSIGSDALATLRAVIDRIVPQPSRTKIDLAARIDRQLASGVGDGWRFAELPSDADAYESALSTLTETSLERHGSDFAALEPRLQDEMLTTVAAGRLDVSDAGPAPLRRLTSAQMKLWFEDVCADAIKLYVAHPDTLARLGYSGIANGGDGLPKSGFARIGVGEREPWEPIAFPDRTS